MDRNTDGRVRKGNGKKARTGRKENRETNNQKHELLSKLAASRPRGPDGRFLPRHQLKECTICAESRWTGYFPNARLSDTCTHDPGACFECIKASIETDFNTKQWTEIGCPECATHLDFDAIAKYASLDTFTKYDSMLVNMAVQEIPGFSWCPLEGCTHGQINAPGEDCPGEPVRASCDRCAGVYCIKHRMVWHHQLTCDEYDIVIRGPSEARDPAEYERLKATMDHVKLIEMQRKAADEKQAELSEKMIKRDTRKCPHPDCGWQIEKAGGCHHMYCSQCGIEFCWDCGVIMPVGERFRPHQHEKHCPHYAGQEANDPVLEGLLLMQTDIEAMQARAIVTAEELRQAEGRRHAARQARRR